MSTLSCGEDLFINQWTEGGSFVRGGTCYHEGEAVTQEKFDALLAAHDARPLALWYEL